MNQKQPPPLFKKQVGKNLYFYYYLYGYNNDCYASLHVNVKEENLIPLFDVVEMEPFYNKIPHLYSHHVWMDKIINKVLKS